MRDNKKEIKILWFSCGATSAVACKLAITDNCRIVYFDIATAHPDNERFIKDCEEWYGQKIEIIRGKYQDQFDVIKKTKYVNGAKGARCTMELKRNIREKFQKENEWDSQVFGFEFNPKEIERSERIPKELNPEFPLIKERLTKENCLGILLKAGIELPTMYKLGYGNNNPCTLDTKIITSTGVKIIGNILGKQVSVLTRTGFSVANIFYKGKQEVLKFELSKRGLQNKTVRATLDHKWYGVRRNRHQIKRDGSPIETKDIRLGDFIPFNSTKSIKYVLDIELFKRGFCYGDGSLNGNFADIRIFGRKIDVFKKLNIKIKKSVNCHRISGLPKYYKTDFIGDNDSFDKKASFFAGLFAADGNISVNGVASISTSKNHNKYKELLEHLGMPLTSIDTRNEGKINGKNKKGVDIVNRTENHSMLFRIAEEVVLNKYHLDNFKMRINPSSGWKVENITNDGVREVACPTIISGDPEFTLDFGLVTGNCIGCVKGGAGYWNKIRIDFPKTFKEMAEAEREVGRSCLKDKKGLIFLDELDPKAGNMSSPLVADCGFFCGDTDEYI